MSQPSPEEEIKSVQLPLKALDKCAQCAKTTSLRLCSSCRERCYCSVACQKQDWPKHKPHCAKIDRIDIESFYPLLACLTASSHLDPEKPVHEAVKHVILNTPNPGVPATVFPDKSAAKLLLLGEPIPMHDGGTEIWWPTAASPSVRSKLFRRIMSEGYVLPIATAICIALLAEVYATTTTSVTNSPDEKLRRCARLQFHSSPISDFGIAKGYADVKDQDKLAYFNFENGTFSKGQDPNDHYWIYFTTVRGEDILLDCGMFTFNFCLVVPAEPYHQEILPPVSYVAAHFRDRMQAHNAPRLQYERKRFSFLRNPKLQQAVTHSASHFRTVDSKAICEFMESIAEGNCTAVEKSLVMRWSTSNCTALRITLKNRAWEKWPKVPYLSIETDPGEMDDMPDEEDEEWWKYMKKWNRKHNRGKITSEELGDAFRSWLTKLSPRSA